MRLCKYTYSIDILAKLQVIHGVDICLTVGGGVGTLMLPLDTMMLMWPLGIFDFFLNRCLG